MIGYIVSGIILAVLGVVFFLIAATLRRVVPTNMVHIVQARKSTTTFGKDQAAGNTYYQWPAWVPRFGVVVTTFPESIFQITLKDYEAYDAARLPFVVDITAFFRVENAEIAAHRVASFHELEDQLKSVLQGAVRRVLATNKLEEIMQERGSLGEKFTNEVREQIAEWGVLPVKTIEFMDLRDSAKSQVIFNIMAKEQSRIDKESRIEIATNRQEAETKEIEAKRVTDVNRQDAEQQVGERTAQKDQAVGLAREASKQAIQEQAALTAEKDMAVLKVQQVTQAGIDKEVAIVQAEQQGKEREIRAEADKKVQVVTASGDKESTVARAEGQLAAAKLNAEGISAEGKAKGEAEQAILMAPVNTQITLAKEIGENQGYQSYLITVKQVEAGQAVGIEMAKAISNADLKVIANAGDPQSGIAQIGDLFSPAGGTKITGMLAALAQSPEGKAILERVTGKSE